MYLPKISIFNKMHLEKKLLILFVVVSGIPLILVNLLWFNSSKDQILKATSSTLVTTTINETNEVDSYFNVKIVGLIIHSQTEPILTQNLPKATDELKAFMLQDSDITQISLLDSSGKEVLKMDRNGVFPTDQLTDQSSSPGFRIPTFAGGERYISQTYFDANGDPGIYISIPVVQPQIQQNIQNLTTSSSGQARKVGSILGVLKVNYTLKSLWKQLDSVTIGTSGYVFLVDDKGNVLASPKDDYQKHQTNLRDVAEVQSFLSSFNTSREDVVKAEETKSETGISSLTAHSKVSATNWGVIAEIPLSDTFAATNQIGLFALALFLIFINAIILIGVWISGKIVEPIRQLQKAVTLAGRGMLNQRIEVRSNDEIGQLAIEFNSMAENLHRSVYQISAERNKVEVILSGITDGVLAVDSNRNIVTFNKVMENITGLQSNQAIGKPLPQVIKLLDKSEELSPDVYCPIKFDGFEGVVFNKKDLTLQCFNKSTPVNLIVGQIREGARVNLGAILTFHDISGEKQFEEMKLDFVSMAAHELRTPLTSIRGYLYILIRDYKKDFDEKQRTVVTRISIATQRLVGLVENLLNVTRIERGALTVRLEPMDWATNIKSIMEEIVDQAKDKKIQLTFQEPSSPLPTVYADKFRVNEVLTNLLSNAITYTQPGGSVRIWTELTPKELITHVQDSGEGIPQSALPHLFTKFFRVSGKLEQGSKGTGLGLYIAKSIIEMHNGRIWAESAGVGKGSTFSFTLPVKQTNQAITNYGQQ